MQRWKCDGQREPARPQLTHNLMVMEEAPGQEEFGWGMVRMRQIAYN